MLPDGKQMKLRMKCILSNSGNEIVFRSGSCVGQVFFERDKMIQRVNVSQFAEQLLCAIIFLLQPKNNNKHLQSLHVMLIR